MISKGFEQVSELMGKNETILTPLDSPIKGKVEAQVEAPVESDAVAEIPALSASVPAFSESAAVATPSKKPKKEKDPNAPKRFSAYQIFINATRPTLHAENSTISTQDLMRMCAQKWNSLSAEEKAVYETMAKEANLREVEKAEKRKSDALIEPVESVEPVTEVTEQVTESVTEAAVESPSKKKKKEKKSSSSSSSSSSGSESPAAPIISSPLASNESEESKPKKEKKHKKEKKDHE